MTDENNKTLPAPGIATPKPEVKPGARSSEFYLAALAMVLITAVILAGKSEHLTALVTGIVTTSGIYTAGRSHVKAKQGAGQ